MITNAWNQLTRPRNPPWSRRTLAPRRRRSGVALVLVIGALTVLTVLVTELAYLSRVQFVITAHQRDREPIDADAVRVGVARGRRARLVERIAQAQQCCSNCSTC